jgi:MOSC domain-containing protein YiiM
MLQVTAWRVPCSQLDVYGPAIKQEIYDKQVKAGDPSSPRWGMSGWYCRVTAPGPAGPGDPVEILASLA